MSKRRRKLEVDPEQVTFLVLAPVSPFLPKHLQAVTGSYSVRANCGHICWVSPEGLDTFLGPTYSMCTPCDLASVEPLSVGPLPDGGRRMTVPGAVEHVEADFGIGQADQMRAWMRDNDIEPT